SPGRSAASMTSTSTGARAGSSVSPSCSRTAVKIGTRASDGCSSNVTSGPPKVDVEVAGQGGPFRTADDQVRPHFEDRLGQLPQRDVGPSESAVIAAADPQLPTCCIGTDRGDFVWGRLDLDDANSRLPASDRAGACCEQYDSGYE